MQGKKVEKSKWQPRNGCSDINNAALKGHLCYSKILQDIIQEFY